MPVGKSLFTSISLSAIYFSFDLGQLSLWGLETDTIGRKVSIVARLQCSWHNGTARKCVISGQANGCKQLYLVCLPSKHFGRTTAADHTHNC